MENVKTQGAKKLSRAQIIGICAFVVAVVLALGGLITVFVINFNKTVPKQVRFVEDDRQVYCQAVANNNFYGYRFRFDDGKDSFTVDSVDALLRVDNISQLSPGTRYNVCVCYLGQNEGGNSEYSPSYTWQAYRYLQAPQVQLQQDRISWEAVDGADFYTVYAADTEFHTIKCEQNYISYADLPAGQIKVVVVAQSDNECLKPSPMAQQTSVTVRHSLKPFSKVEYNKQTHLLTIRASEEVEIVELFINDSQTLVVKDLAKSPTGYTYTIDLSFFEEEITKIGARPASNSEYKTYAGEYVFE